MIVKVKKNVVAIIVASILLGYFLYKFHVLVESTYLEYTLPKNFTTFFTRSYGGDKFCGKRFSSKNVKLATSLLNFTYKNAKGDVLSDLDIIHTDPVFVTGFSDNHADEAFAMLSNIRTNFNGKRTIIVYDLGIS